MKKKLFIMATLPILFTSSLFADVTALKLTINQSTEKDLKSINCKFKKEKVNDKRLSTYSTNGSCYKIGGLKKVLVTFVDKKLKFIDGVFNKDGFETIKNTMDEKYGEPSSSEIPFVGDSYAEWQPENENTLIRLDAPHLSFEMQLIYIDMDYLQEVNGAVEKENNNKAKHRENVL